MSAQEFKRQNLPSWPNHMGSLDAPEPNFWRQVDPMIRGVWNMAQVMRDKQIIVEEPWLSDFVLKTMKGEERAADGDSWPTNNSTLDEYFYADGFGGLKYGLRHALQVLQRENSTYVDWFAPPDAVRSAAMMPDVNLGMGISACLGSVSEDMPSNIHHLSGSLFDPSVHAKMIGTLNGRKIDLFTARPKGGVSLFPRKSSADSFEYHLRLLNTVYRRMSPGGLLFTELPGSDPNEFAYLWGSTIDIWTHELQDKGVDISSNGHALVIKKAADMPALPALSHKTMVDNPSRYMGSRQLGCRGYIATSRLCDQDYRALLEADAKLKA